MEITWNNYEIWLASQLTNPEPFKTINAHPPLPSQWSTDSRTIEPGQWFIPLQGPHFDGHQYIAETIQKGAVGFLYQKDAAIPSTIKHLGISVSSPLKCYQMIALGWRQALPNLKLVALTGSNGKTTTKELLAKILRELGPTLATESNYNNEIGVPKTLLSLTEEHRFAVLEFGARFPGNIKELMEIAAPDITCLLNAGMAHIGIFGSLEKLRHTKLEVFKDLKPGGIQAVPYDDPIILKEALKLNNKSITFGVHPKADVQLLDLNIDAKLLKIQFTLKFRNEIYPVTMHSIHKILGINSAAAFAMCVASGISPSRIASGLQNFSGVKGRFQISHHSDFSLIDDSYNANPNSMIAGFESLKSLTTQRPLILMVGDMLELGDLALAEHRRIGLLAAQLNPDQLFFIGSHSLHLKAGAQDAGFEATRIHCYPHVDGLLDTLNLAKMPWTCQQPAIYVKASRGTRLDRVIEALKLQS